METMLLCDAAVNPDDKVLEAALAGNYGRYRQLCAALAEKNLTMTWRYYNDGKQWLCRVLNKKKTVCWLSVWDAGFKTTFYFTESTITGVRDLAVRGAVKALTVDVRNIGKLFPLILLVDSDAMLADALAVIDYKKSLK